MVAGLVVGGVIWVFGERESSGWGRVGLSGMYHIGNDLQLFCGKRKELLMKLL